MDKSNPEIFDSVNVYGNIYDSKIHNNYFGVYTYGKCYQDANDTPEHCMVGLSQTFHWAMVLQGAFDVKERCVF